MISKSLVLLSSLMLFIAIMAVAVSNAKKGKNPLQVRCPKKEKQTTPQFTPRSCLDYFKNGYKNNGFYKIYLHDVHGSTLTVYCDMNSEAGAAWTLVESFALKNKDIPEFYLKGLPSNAPVNENSPNWKLYRMTLANMNALKSQSTHWRATCSFPVHRVDYTDYVRAAFADFDIMTFLKASGCKKVEYVNIRGHRCAHCMTQWWQGSTYAGHIDSSSTGCEFKPKQGSTASEDNFGYYRGTINNKFRCTSGPSSTTNWWIGGYQ